MTTNTVVNIEHVNKTYAEGRVRALKDVSLKVPEKAFLSLAGPSGSGKTTLLNIIGALDVPDDGTVTVEGQNLSELNDHKRTRLRRERIGFIFQQFNLVPVLRAWENVSLPLEILPGYNRESRKKAAMDMLKLVGLQGMEDRRPSRLSGGQQQRVAIARALVKHPAIVLADEPTANLDGETGVAIVELMKKMREELGTAFILSTHDPRVIDRVDTLITLVDGRINS